MKIKIHALDGLRGVMALWVFVSHVTTMAGLAIQKNVGWGWILANGEFAVGVFILLSGFVIMLNIMASQPLHKSDFWTRRALRLFPVYLICLAASTLMIDISIDALHALPESAQRLADRLRYLEASKTDFFKHLLLHAGLLHGLVPERILPSTSYAFMGQAWSLTLEWQFYLVAPFFCALLQKTHRHWIRMGVLLGVLLAASRGFPQVSALPSFLWLFAMGAYAALLYQRRADHSLSGRALLGYMAAFTAAALVHGSIAASVAIFATVLYAIVSPNAPTVLRGLKSALEHSTVQFLGRVSYGFYCVHMLVIFGCAHALLISFGIQEPVAYAFLLVTSSLAVSLGISWALNRLVEEPAIRFGKHLVNMRSKSRASNSFGSSGLAQ